MCLRFSNSHLLTCVQSDGVRSMRVYVLYLHFSISQYPFLLEPTRLIISFSFNVLMARSIVPFPSEVTICNFSFVMFGVSIIASRTALSVDDRFIAPFIAPFITPLFSFIAPFRIVTLSIKTLSLYSGCGKPRIFHFFEHSVNAFAKLFHVVILV